MIDELPAVVVRVLLQRFNPKAFEMVRLFVASII